MPAFTAKRYETLMPIALARLVVLAKLFDVTDSSSAKNVIAACMRALEEAYFQASLIPLAFSIDTATGPDLDARAAEIQPATIKRIPAVAAVGTVVFSRQTTTGTITIPIGTQIKTAGGQLFSTTAVGTISPTSAPIIPGDVTGQDSGQVPVVAVTPGSAGNVVTGTIVSFVQKPAGVTSVTNTVPTLLGQDRELDDAFRQRLKNYVASLPRSTPQAIASGVLGAQDPTTTRTILFSSVYENPITPGYVTLYVDDGTGQAESIAATTGEVMTEGLAGPPPNSAVGGETRLNLLNYPVYTTVAPVLVSNTRGTLTMGTQYTLDATSGLVVFSPALVASEVITAAYSYFTGIIALAQKIVDGDPTDPTDYPGLRAAGIQVQVLTPTIVVPSINATLTVADGFDAATVETTVQNAILTYVNSLGISGDVLYAALFQSIMNVPGVSNVVLNSPSADTIVLSGQLARITAANVVIT